MLNSIDRGVRLPIRADCCNAGRTQQRHGLEETARARRDPQRGGRRRGWLLGHTNESQVRLQIAADQAGSNHTGDCRNSFQTSILPLLEAVGLNPVGDRWLEPSAMLCAPCSRRRLPWSRSRWLTASIHR
jgi:hypothetical protein